MGSKSGGRSSGGRQSRVGGGASPAEAALGVSSGPPVDAPKNVTVYGYGADTKQQLKKIFPGKEVSQDELVKLSGALDGSEVQIDTGHHTIEITWRSAEGRATRTLYREAGGDVVIHNDIFKINESHRGQGHAPTSLAREVDQAAKLGVKRIETEAARMTGVFNGYYTWPRLGYDAKLTSYQTRALREDVTATASMQKAAKVSDLMKTSEGRDWWRRNGVSTNMTFDLSPGSMSRRVLDGYRAAYKERSK